MSCCEKPNCNDNCSVYDKTADDIAELLDRHMKTVKIGGLKGMTQTEWAALGEDSQSNVKILTYVNGKTRSITADQLNAFRRVTAEGTTLTTDTTGVPLGATMFSRFDLGTDAGAYRKAGSTVTRESEKDFFEQVLDRFPGFTGVNSWIIPEEDNLFIRLAGDGTKGINAAGSTPTTGGQDEFTVGSANLEALNVIINDPGHGHGFDLIESASFGAGGNTAYIRGGGNVSNTANGNTGISGRIATGIGGNGVADPIDNKPKFTTRYEYVKVRYVN